MAFKKMKIQIDRTGQTAIQVEGAQGDECLVFTQALEKALGKIQQRTMLADNSTPVMNREILQEKL